MNWDMDPHPTPPPGTNPWKVVAITVGALLGFTLLAQATAPHPPAMDPAYLRAVQTQADAAEYQACLARYEEHRERYGVRRNVFPPPC